MSELLYGMLNMGVFEELRHVWWRLMVVGVIVMTSIIIISRKWGSDR